MPFDLRQNFVSTQYLENKLTDFLQILYYAIILKKIYVGIVTHHFCSFEAELWPLISKKNFSAQYLQEKWTDFDQTLYDFFILTRSTLGLLAVIFRKFVRELCPSIDVRITLPLNILRNSVLLLYAKHCSGAIVRFSYNSSLADLCRRLIGKLLYQSLLRPSVSPSSAQQHFQTSLKPLGQFNSNFIWRLLRTREQSLFKWSWSHDQDDRHAHIW